MDFQEIKAEVFRRLEENSSAPVYFSESEVEDAINEGYEEISDASEWSETTSTINLLPGQVYYWLGHSSVKALTPTAAYNNQNDYWLQWTTVGDLDRSHSYWETSQGEPTQMFTRGLGWIGFWPIAESSGGTITLYHTTMPAALSAASDEPGFPQEFHFALVEYALYDLLAQEAEVAKALQFWGRYKEKEAGLKRFVERRAKDRRTAFTGGPGQYPERLY